MLNPWLNSTAVAAAATSTEVTVHRQPIVRPDRSVHGYAVSVVVRAPLSKAHHGNELDSLVHAEYEKIDLATLGGGDVVFVRATVPMLTDEWPLPETEGGLVLEIPRHFAELPDATTHLGRLRAAGLGLALADFVAGGDQDSLLPFVDFVKVDLWRGGEISTQAARVAHAAGVAVIAERVDNEASVDFCAAQEVELLQGPLFQRDSAPVVRAFTVNELQCFELLQLLGADEIDQAGIARVIDSDPELVMRVLRLVNSSVFAVRHKIDSVRQAVTLLGPKQLGALAASALLDSGGNTISGLWFVLTRAIACRSIARDDAAYTVGLLSAVAAQLKVAPGDLVARTGVSDDVSRALRLHSGPFGPALAAVLAHEENDIEAVEATGLSHFDVAHCYLAAVAEALTTVMSLNNVAEAVSS